MNFNRNGMKPWNTLSLVTALAQYITGGLHKTSTLREAQSHFIKGYQRFARQQ